MALQPSIKIFIATNMEIPIEINIDTRGLVPLGVVRATAESGGPCRATAEVACSAAAHAAPQPAAGQGMPAQPQLSGQGSLHASGEAAAAPAPNRGYDSDRTATPPREPQLKHDALAVPQLRQDAPAASQPAARQLAPAESQGPWVSKPPDAEKLAGVAVWQPPPPPPPPGSPDMHAVGAASDHHHRGGDHNNHQGGAPRLLAPAKAPPQSYQELQQRLDRSLTASSPREL